MTDFNGRSIGYDTIGNIVSYYNGSSYSFTWEKGRQLSTLQKGDTSVSYSYNADGLRTSKTVNGTKTSYVWDGNTLLGQQGGGKTLIFLYDATGLYGFRYNGNTYFYLYNGQGDVAGLINTSGTQVVSYTYDAWGKPLTTTGSLASTIGEINPIRYRGYYYDAESGLYYLQSRYYDPVVGRFINADGLVSTGQGILGTNMFAYCGNNPVNYRDPSGLYWIGNVSGKRYDSLSCTTRYYMQLNEGGIENCTYYKESNKMPIEGANRNNDWPRYKTSGKIHSGTDLSVPVGTPVHAVERGIVIAASDEIKVQNLNTTGLDTYGTYIFIKTFSGVEMRYAHLSQLNVSVGDIVEAWDVIGLSGNTGNSHGPHLHFQVVKDGKNVDPYDYIDNP